MRVYAVTYSTADGRRLTDYVRDAAGYIEQLKANGRRKIRSGLVRCRRCWRPLRSLVSAARGAGRVCAAKLRGARIALDDFTREQLDAARDVLADGGVVATAKPTVFRVIASDGSRTYLTSPRGCTCIRGRYRKPCRHRAAACLHLAA
jgi:hypothetical protein